MAAVFAFAPSGLLAGCGDDEPPGAGSGDASATNRPPDTADRAAKVDTAAETTIPADGRLTTPSGRIVTDWGDKRDNRAAVAALVGVQRAFQSGQMEEACASIDFFMMSQFTPRGTGPETACPRKLEAYAGVLREKGAAQSRMKVLWVRSYGTTAGVWVDDRNGRSQIPLTAGGKGRHKWQLELGAMASPDVLNAAMTGTARFGVE